MKNYAKIFRAVSLSAVLSLSASAETIKVAFLAPDLSNAENAAVLNGVQDALKDMEFRFSCKFQVEYISADNSAQKQLSQMSNAFIDNFKAAIVYPVSGGEAALGKRAEEMAQSGFYTASVGAKISDVIPAVATDTQKTAQLVSDYIAKFSRGREFSLVGYFRILGEVRAVDAADSAQLAGLLYPSLNVEQFRKIVAPYKVLKLAAMDYYSVYAAAHAIEILRYDNYGEIFFNPRLLSDTAPIKPDTDRLFAICVGALPQFEFYLKSGQLNACVYDDYYGWGYFSAREIAERLFKVSSPAAKRLRLLPPLKADASSISDFSSDWRKWLK